MSKYELPEHIFRYGDGASDVNNEVRTAQKVNIAEGVTFDKGVFLHLKGAYHPQKVMATPEIMYAFNLAKRHIIEPLKFLNKWYFYPGLLITMRKPETFIESFNMMTWRFIKPHLLKEEFMTPQSKELEWTVYMFLKKIGIKDHNAEQFSATLAHAIEYDSAYRLIVVDLLNILNKELLIKNPRKELLRVAQYFVERNTDKTMNAKFMAVIKLTSLVLILPKYKKALSDVARTIDFSKFQADEVDIYWMCLREDWYQYLGLTDKERNAYRREMKKRRPLTIKQ